MPKCACIVWTIWSEHGDPVDQKLSQNTTNFQSMDFYKEWPKTLNTCDELSNGIIHRFLQPEVL